MGNKKIFLLGVLVIGGFLILNLSFKLNHKYLFLMLMIIIFLSFGILYIKNSLPENLVKQMVIIGNKTSHGFSIIKVNNKKSIKWYEVTSVKFNRNHTHLILKSKIHGRFFLLNSVMGWYKLIRSVPKYFREFDFEYVDNFFKTLESCEICGCAAKKEANCHYCYSKAYTNEIKTEFKTKDDYIRYEQLEFFAVDKDEEFKGFYSKPGGFDPDEKWQPLITENELMDYRKKEYWKEE